MARVQRGVKPPNRRMKSRRSQTLPLSRLSLISATARALRRQRESIQVESPPCSLLSLFDNGYRHSFLFLIFHARFSYLLEARCCTRQLSCCPPYPGTGTDEPRAARSTRRELNSDGAYWGDRHPPLAVAPFRTGADLRASQAASATRFIGQDEPGLYLVHPQDTEKGNQCTCE